jgi:hypothetical protein
MKIFKGKKPFIFGFLIILYLYISSQIVIQPNISNTVWDDLRIDTGLFQFVGASDPVISDYQPTGAGTTFKLYAFQKTNEAFAAVQMPHRYKEGTDLYFHIHWTPRDRGNEESGNTVGWKVDYSISNVNGTFPVSGTADLSDTVTGTDDKHEITSSVQVTGTGLNISHMLLLRIYRTDTGTDDTWVGTTVAQSPCILEFDIHYEINSLGSNNATSKL